MITAYCIPIGAKFHASPQSKFFGEATVIGGGGSTIHVEYETGRQALLNLLPVERAYKGSIPANLLAAWRVEDGNAP